jgi:hypothetical protein
MSLVNLPHHFYDFYHITCQAIDVEGGQYRIG